MGNLGGIAVYEILILAFAVLVMPAISIRAGMRLSRAEPDSLVPRYVSAILRGWVVALLLLALWRWADRPLDALGLDIPIGLRGRLGFLLDAGLLLFFVAQQARLARLPQGDFDTLVRRIARLKVAPRRANELLVFFLVSVTAGVWEELLYRGFLMGFLEPRAGLVAALVFSSAIFGLGHMYQGWRGVLNTALVGLAFALLYALTKSLWWLMLAHALIDMNGGLAAYRVSMRAREAGAVKVNWR
jgi:membrane protease YdiL (CAAX protease family)